MNNKYFALALAPALALTIAVGANAQFNTEEKGEGRMQRGGQMQQFMESVTRSVEKTTNGTVETISSTDAEVVVKLQANADKRGGKERENVTVAIANTANGVMITTTTDDADILAKLHEQADNPTSARGRGGKGGKRGGEMSEEHQAMKDSITKTVTNLDNGVKVAVTSTDSDVVTKMQEREVRASKNDEVSVSKVNITNGVETTVTTTNAELVEGIQARAEKSGKGGKRGGKGGRDFGKRQGDGERGGYHGEPHTREDEEGDVQ